MKEKTAFTKGRVIGFSCCALIPAAAIFCGIRLLIKGAIFNTWVAFTFILLPLVALGLLAWCLFSGCKTLKKAILSGVILAVFVISFFISMIFTDFVKVERYNGEEAAARYASAADENELMPELSEIGKPSEIAYRNVFACFFIFEWETDYLICRYAPDEYEIRKAALETEYTFQSETITEYKSNCEPSAEVDGYQFRLLSVEEYNLYYPKELLLIGYSDNAREIVYVAFEDFDLDYISSLEEFIIDECGWEHIR